jgi:uncharacterized protein (TIGR03435 family)
MLQTMLTDRCKLKVHFETKELPVYDLVIAKGGLKMKEATPDEKSIERNAHQDFEQGGETAWKKAS